MRFPALSRENEEGRAMKRHPIWRALAVAVAISVVAVIVRTHGTDALNPQVMSGKIAAVAEVQLGARGYDPHLTDTACSPLRGNDPAEASNWDCSALDHWGDVVRFGASDRYGHIAVEPIAGVTHDEPQYLNGDQRPPVAPPDVYATTPWGE
jgi:hypothetical protein